MNDTLMLGGREFHSRFILGSGKYSLKLIEAAVRDAGAELITLAVRRANTREQENILDYIPKGVTLLPNTSGARNAEEAVRIARLARELGCGDFVKVEIMRDSKYLLPDNAETVRATELLAREGFVVLPYMYPDLYAARALADAGAAAVMPLASPIGSNKGLATRISSRSLSMRSICPSSWMRALAALPGLRGHGDGGGSHHGQHRPGYCRRPAPHGRRLPPGHRGRPEGLSVRPRAGAQPRGRPIRSPHRLSPGLRGRNSMENRFWWTLNFSPQALARKHQLETDPLLPEEPHGVSARHGAAPV